MWSPPPGWSLPRKKWLKPDLVEAGRAGVGGDVPADADLRALRAVHQHRGVPPDVRPDPALDVLVAGEPGLPLRRDGVDVVGGGQRRDADLALPGPLEQAQHDVAGALGAALVDDAVERLDPLAGLLGVDVRKLARQAVADHRALAFRGHRHSSMSVSDRAPHCVNRTELLQSCPLAAGVRHADRCTGRSHVLPFTGPGRNENRTWRWGCRRWGRPGRSTARCPARSGRRSPAATRTAGRRPAARGRGRARRAVPVPPAVSVGSTSSMAVSRSSSEPAPVSMIATPAVACGTKTCSRPSPSRATNCCASAVMSRTTGRPPVSTVITSLRMGESCLRPRRRVA